MKHVGEGLFVLVLLALMAATARCTIKVETPPWPEAGIVPPIQVPCVESRDAGWTCVWPDSSARLYIGQMEPCPGPGRCDVADRPVCGPNSIYYRCDANGWWNAEQTDAATCERWCQ